MHQAINWRFRAVDSVVMFLFKEASSDIRPDGSAALRQAYQQFLSFSDLIKARRGSETRIVGTITAAKGWKNIRYYKRNLNINLLKNLGC